MDGRRYHVNGNGTHMNGNGYLPELFGEPDEKERSLHDVIEILLKGKWYILAALVVTLVATATYTFTQDPVYEAGSVVHVSNDSNTPQLNELMGTSEIEAARSIATEIEIIRSLSSAQRVAEALLFPDDSSGAIELMNAGLLTIMRTEGGGAIDPAVLARRLHGRIEVRAVSAEVDLIQITARSTVPEEAQLIANLFASTYRDFSLKSSRERMTASRQFLDEISTTFSEQLKQAEDELTEFLHEESIIEPDAEARQILQQISELQQEQTATQLQLGVAQAELKRLEQELDRITPGLAAQISSSDNLVIDHLKKQIANLQFEEQQIYASNPERRSQPRSGRLAEIERELAVLTQQLNELVDRLLRPVVSSRMDEIASASATSGSVASTDEVLQSVASLRGRITDKSIAISGLNARSELLESQLEEHKVRLSQIPAKSVVLQRLQRSQRAQEQLYLSLLDELQQARIAERSELGSIKIVDRAALPTTPVSPRVFQNLVFGAVFGMLLGIGLAFVRNAFDDKIRRPEDIEPFHVDVLSVIPHFDNTTRKHFGDLEFTSNNGHAKKYSTSLVGLLLPSSIPTQAYRELRVNIQFAQRGKEVKTVVVTSPEPGNGKTVTALNLSIMMAQAGNETLHIDADLHRPSVDQLLDIPREPGLTDELMSSEAPDLERYRTEIENLSVLPAGQKVPYPAEMLGSRRMRELLTQLQESYDVIVLDTPPLLADIDAVVLASMSDATLLVCAANDTHRHAAQLALEKLKQVDAPIAGVVLNRFDAVQAFGARSYGARYGYADYGYG